MIRICIQVLALLLVAQSLFAEETAEGSLFVELLEYRFTGDVALFDAEAEYGTSTHRAVLKLVTLSAKSQTETAAALLYRRGISNKFDLQVGVEFAGENRHFVLGFQAEAPHHIATELVTLFDKHGDGYLIGKIEHDWSLTERLVLWPRLEIFAALQSNDENGVGSGPRLALTDLRLRYEMHPRFIPYIGVSWEQTLGDSAQALEAAGEDKSIVTALVGASFSF